MTVNKIGQKHGYVRQAHKRGNWKIGNSRRKEKSKLILYEPTQTFEFGKIRCLD